MKTIFLTILMSSCCTVGAFAQYLSLDEVDIPPLFAGCLDPLTSQAQQQACSNPKIQAFIKEHIQYPDSAKENGIEGLVVVRFAINEEGKISKLELLRDIGGGCGQEAMRVIRMLPDFAPAMHQGEAVATQMALPVRFRKIETAQNNNQNLYQIHWGTTYKEGIAKQELTVLSESTPLVIRDYYGNIYPITSLTLEVQSKNKIKAEKGKGNELTPAMQKLLSKVKPQQQITWTAIIKKDYEDIEVKRTLLVEGKK